ncbi:ABC transporter ATP-binding protein [Rhizobiaceae bacterium n13]|uniref:ABC transporter ATP-binding protein n=1 Tax=Ferirhizobium litorale TaxID=2927786 RepID=UPI0024B295F9|nr:ABC transporter ATP-binding protein [Fererhizobium litorale]MDI7861886.1 ABC transporter ATP-binding protein [Fererhizobium litorale]
MNAALLEIDNLSIAIDRPGGAGLPLLTDISLQLGRGETLGIVGESGSGKSLLALGVIGLLPEGIGSSGSIRLDGTELLPLADDDLCKVRGRRIGMIFQEPMTALNPVMKVGDQIAEGIVWHRGVGWCDARRDAVRLLDQVRIPDAAIRAKSYPHELSGGQRQRVGIAIALASKPDLLIADEPTTALDVSVQKEILEILDEHVRNDGMALMLVSHDLGVIAASCRRTMVLYAGARMEEGLTEEVLSDPRSPYTRGLLAALPQRRIGDRRLAAIPGNVPGFAALPPGCRFSDRCPDRIERCQTELPAWRSFGNGRGVRCIRAETAASEAG